ncbi:MAG: coproporphyrinogen dehydrogenase HemZ [Clostridia bacterium]|nr:coproporphyrinogen dehydrogenase HemZ [Clostridia bacterium]
MRYLLEGHAFKNAVQDLLICLFPDERHTAAEDGAGDDLCRVAIEPEDGAEYVCVTVRRGGRLTEERSGALPSEDGEEAHAERASQVRETLYLALLPHLSAPPVWGSMTGVKPAKAARLYMESGHSEAEAECMLAEKYFVTPRRRRLCVAAAKCAMEEAVTLAPREAQLYIGIPFCPAKCSYCSFVSNNIQRSGHLVEPYLETLLAEIAAAGEMTEKNGVIIGSIYIGGGTPTVLDEAQLGRLLRAAERAFDRSGCREYTVEAGRPETITREKLALMRDFGVDRISINPQSMDDGVLAGVGRRHTAEDIENAYRMARATGEFIINMDLIAGLPGDAPEGFLQSVRRVAALEPENITVHSLARKHGAAMAACAPDWLDAGTMDRAYEYLEERGYEPYYIYRQKYIAGGLENTGFCRRGARSRYNICMMEELGDVIALGAGGVSKLCSMGGRRVRRVANPKYPLEYIQGGEEICRRKRELTLIFEG